ncbi:MAG: hypothetical protein P8M30_07260 [Planctomycetaceae bacterium]|nr:hypothetical protein [Planctomycetaceae bacterium]
MTEREKVVTALTSRLEQAAEQLDRLHRSGVDRGGKLLSGIPAEVIDEQRELINDLKSAIHHWEDLQSTSAMGRFEAQLAELREMLGAQLQLKDNLSTTGTPSSVGKGKDFGPATQSNNGGSWDEMKARLLGDQGGPSPDDSSDIIIPNSEMIPGVAAIPLPSTPANQEVNEPNDFSFSIKDRPEAVANIKKADSKVLLNTIELRDDYIDHLLEAIEHLKEEAGMADLEDSRKRQLDLEEKLRQSEIEMSMERAKLAREEFRLKQLEQELNNPSARKDTSAPLSDNEDEGGNRWVRFLGSK